MTSTEARFFLSKNTEPPSRAQAGSAERIEKILDEITSARGACAIRDVIARHLGGAGTSAAAAAFTERTRIIAKARRHAKVIQLDFEGAAALEDFATLLEREP